MMTWPADNKTERVAHIHVDKLDDAWVNRVSGVDFLQLSTGNNKPATGKNSLLSALLH